MHIAFPFRGYPKFVEEDAEEDDEYLGRFGVANIFFSVFFLFLGLATFIGQQGWFDEDDIVQVMESSTHHCSSGTCSATDVGQ